MDELRELFNMLFPNGFGADTFTTIFSALFATIISVKSAISSKKVILSGVEKTNAELEAAKAQQEAKDAKKAISVLGSMMITIFLNANTIDADTKKQLTTYANALEVAAGVELDPYVKAGLNVINKYTPEKTTKEKEEALIAAANKVEAVLDTVSSQAKEAISRLNKGE